MQTATTVRLAVALSVLPPALLLAAITFGVWLRTHPHVPVFDCLLLLPLAISVVADGFTSVAPGQWVELFGGAHRILMPRLLLVADQALLAGNNHLPFAVSWLSIAVVLWLYTRALSTRRQTVGALLVAGVALAFLLSPGQLYNLLTPINTPWFITLAAGSVAFSLMLARGQTLGGGAVAIILAMGPLAAFGTFAGVILCMMIALVALLYGVRYRWLIAALLALFVGLYLVGVQSGSSALAEDPRFIEMLNSLSEEQLREMAAAQPPDPTLVERVARTVRLTAAELSLPVYRWSPAVAYSLSGLSFAGLAWCWSRVLLDRLRRRGAAAQTTAGEFYLLMATLCLGIALSIWIGRDTTAEPGVIRYRTVCMGYWMSVMCLCVHALASIRNTPLWVSATGLVVALTATLSLGGTADYVQKAATMGEAAANAQALGTLGVKDFKTHRSILPMGGWDGYYGRYYDFFATRQFSAGRWPEAGDLSGDARCNALVFKAGATGWPGVRQLRAVFSAGDGQMGRAAYVYANGQAVGMLFPAAPAVQDVVPWMLRGSTVWRGYYRCESCDDTRLSVMYEPLVGARFTCPVESVAALPPGRG